MHTGSLLQAARADYAKIASAGGFEVSAILTTKSSIIPAVSISVTGLGTGTWMVFDNMTSGKPTNATSDSFNIPEDQLIAAGYPYTKADGTISIKGHTIQVTENGSLGGLFVINEQHYNATLGMVIVILGKKSS